MTPKQIEQTIFAQLKKFADGGIPATLHSEELGITLPVNVIPITPQIDGFAFEDFTLYQTSKVWEIETAKLCGYQPKELDILVLNDNPSEPYKLKKTNSGQACENVGVYTISKQIYTVPTENETPPTPFDPQWGGITGTISDQTDLQQALNGSVQLVSPATQIINSDIAIALNKQILLTAADLTQHTGIAIREYANGQQLEVGSETIPACFNHKAVEGWSTNNITVNYKDVNNVPHVDKVAYLSDLLNKVNNTFAGNTGTVLQSITEDADLSSTISLQLESVNVNGSGTSATELPLSIASASNAGIQPAENYAQVETNRDAIAALAQVAKTGSYNDLADKPTIVPSPFRGVFGAMEDIPLPADNTWQPPVVHGDYVIISVPSSPDQKYIADIDDNTWEAAGSTSVGDNPLDGETVKQLYESNADTNAYTNAEKSKLDGLPSAIPNQIVSSNTAGKVFIESNKVGSVNGWDTLNANVTASTNKLRAVAGGYNFFHVAVQDGANISVISADYDHVQIVWGDLSDDVNPIASVIAIDTTGIHVETIDTTFDLNGIKVATVDDIRNAEYLPNRIIKVVETANTATSFIITVTLSRALGSDTLTLYNYASGDAITYSLSGNNPYTLTGSTQLPDGYGLTIT